MGGEAETSLQRMLSSQAAHNSGFPKIQGQYIDQTKLKWKGYNEVVISTGADWMTSLCDIVLAVFLRGARTCGGAGNRQLCGMQAGDVTFAKWLQQRLLGNATHPGIPGLKGRVPILVYD